MNRQAFFTAYRAMLFQYAQWARDAGALESFMQRVADSVDGKPPYLETFGPIADLTWRQLWQEGDCTVEKLRALP